MKDDEGKEEDVTESQRIAFVSITQLSNESVILLFHAQETDSPKDAQSHEEAVARFEEGAPGQTEDVGKAEQKENPAETNRAGTTQDKPEGPSGMGDARKEAKVRHGHTGLLNFSIIEGIAYFELFPQVFLFFFCVVICERKY